jgi:uncharacterized membrane protein YciS (DUF1049 family)
MSKIRFLLEATIALFVIVIAATFALANETLVVVDVLITSVQLNVGVALLIALGIGGLLGYLVRLPSSLVMRAQLSQAERKLKKASSDAPTA